MLENQPQSGSEYTGFGVYCSMLIIGITLFGIVMACILEFAIPDAGEYIRLRRFSLAIRVRADSNQVSFLVKAVQIHLVVALDERFREGKSGVTGLL